ncbi:MAG: hypothetical protein GY822_16685 [Deltaproteobacteria bacterium]|nr:hypothetical protein [Deltaproteobacteria bacterium]
MPRLMSFYRRQSTFAQLLQGAFFSATAFAFLGFSVLGCDESVNDPATGNIDRIADAVFVQPDSDAVPRQSFVLMTNPDLEQVRIFDAYEHRFVRAPNVYFPLSIPVGVSTRKLAVAPKNHSLVFALDGAEDKIYVIRTDDQGGAPFTLVDDVNIQTSRTPADIAASTTETGIRLFLSYPDDGEVVVMHLETGAKETTIEATLSLFDGARPNILEVDPTEDALLIGDALSELLTVVRLEDLVIDRVLDVGGAVQHISTGLLDPGDGLAPIALLTLRDKPEATALRLFRPTHREDRYAVLGRIELPAPGAVSYLPHQLERELTTSTVCCPILPVANEATTAWGAVLTSTGLLYYVRFDGETEDGARGRFRLIDIDADAPSVESSTWTPPEGSNAEAPLLLTSLLTELPTPAYIPYSSPGDVQFVWEGALNGANDDVATVETGGDLIEFVRDIQQARPGDTLVFNIDERVGIDGACDDFVDDGLEKEIIGVESARILDVGILTSAERNCLTVGGSFTASIHVDNAFLATSSTRGSLGRLSLQETVGVDPDVVEADGFVFSVENDGNPLPRGGILQVRLEQNISPLSLGLSDPASNTNASGFGRGALFPRAIVGGEVSVPGLDEEPDLHTRRVYLVTGTGSLLTFNETETLLDFVLDFQ